MQRFPKVSGTISGTIAALTVLVAPAILSAGSASAQPIRFSDSYIGAGVSAGVTNGGQGNDSALLGGNIQGRLGLPSAPVSLRGTVLYGGDTSAIIPTVSYDQRISDNANVYVGAGYSFVEEEGVRTPLGNKDSVVLTAGAEAGVGKNVVVYGDAKWGIDAYKNSPADAVSFQAGVGYRF
ncbi:MAG TPA: outer membrane beta-barrel protein [Thermosynechococcaceae cyanobacterium]